MASELEETLQRATLYHPPAEGKRTVSKETLVRMEGLVKIMASVLPAKGLKLWSSAFRRALTAADVSSIATAKQYKQEQPDSGW